VDLDRLDAELGGEMVVQLGNRKITLPSARTVPWKHLPAMMQDPLAFAALFWPADAPLQWWQLVPVRDAWARHNGLPDAKQVSRLLFMLGRFGDGIEYDLRNHLGISMGVLFRERRWRELLNLIDQLPQATHLNRLLTTDEEYMEAAIRQEKGGGSSAPSRAEWGQVEELLAKVVDAINRLTVTERGLAGDKTAKTPPPLARPKSIREDIEQRIIKERHQSMVDMLLPRSV
jgi:hypothetical protein